MTIMIEPHKSSVSLYQTLGLHMLIVIWGNDDMDNKRGLFETDLEGSTTVRDKAKARLPFVAIYSCRVDRL
jgi:hypothetical protein